MGKLIRRCGSFLMMLLLVIGILPMTVNAETTQNTEERNALYVQVPEDWENPCVWAWDSDGNNAFTAWPGDGDERKLADFLGSIPDRVSADPDRIFRIAKEHDRGSDLRWSEGIDRRKRKYESKCSITYTHVPVCIRDR